MSWHTFLSLQGRRPDDWPEYVTVSHEGWRQAGRRYVPERMCRNVTPCDDGWNFSCSACGYDFSSHGYDDHGDRADFRYCPNCGARVTGRVSASEAPGVCRNGTEVER